MFKLLLCTAVLALAPACLAERQYVLTYSRAELTTATGLQSVYRRIVAAASPLGTEVVPLADAVGRLLPGLFTNQIQPGCAHLC